MKQRYWGCVVKIESKDVNSTWGYYSQVNDIKADSAAEAAQQVVERIEYLDQIVKPEDNKDGFTYSIIISEVFLGKDGNYYRLQEPSRPDGTLIEMA